MRNDAYFRREFCCRGLPFPLLFLNAILAWADPAVLSMATMARSEIKSWQPICGPRSSRAPTASGAKRAGVVMYKTAAEVDNFSLFQP